MELGKKIRQLRFKAELTQEQLAERLNVSPQAVSKWENAAAMPDIALLPRLSEVFGVSIDDLFDLTVQQRLNRIESRLDLESDLSQDVFLEYEEYLKSLLTSREHGSRATELIAYLYWHRMDAMARNVTRYARDAVRLSPGKKGCQWMLQRAENHAAWDWNIANHSKAIAFYRQLAKDNPDEVLPWEYLLDNLIADHRTQEAEQALARLEALGKVSPVILETYRAGIALARFDAPAADAIVERMLKEHPEDSACLFEAAQYFARKCDYDRAVACYEASFEKDPRRPRFIDALWGIADIHEINGDYAQAAKAWDRIVDLTVQEWGITEGTELKNAQNERARLLSLAQEGGDSN